MTESTRPIRVLQVIHGLHIGGAENVVAGLSQELDRARFRVAVLCTNIEGALAERARSGGGTEVRVLAAGGRRGKLRALNAVIEELRPDCLHSHGMTALLTLGPARFLRRRIPWVHTFHFGNYPHVRRRYLWGERVFARLPDRLVAVSETQRRAVEDHLWVPRGRLCTIINGVAERPEFADPDNVSEARRALGCDDDELVVGTIAVLSEQKGIAHLLEAARQLGERHQRLRFVVIGGGPLEDELHEQARRSGVAERVHFAGWRPDAAALLPAFDVFAMPSLWEGLPLALLEAMAAARPIVTTRVGDNARLIDDGRNGRVVEPGDAAGLAAAIDDLAGDAGLRQRLGSAARDDYRRHLTLDAMVAQYTDLYTELAAMAGQQGDQGNAYDGA